MIDDSYVAVDDIWQQIGPLFHRPGPSPVCSDSEVLTLALVGEWREHRDMFPHLLSQSRFNRCRRRLAAAFNLIRRAVLGTLDLVWDSQAVIDSLPVPVIQFHLVPSSPGASSWKSYGAAFGKVSTKKQTIFDYKLHLLLSLNGVILDFELAPANASDLVVGEELLAEYENLEVIGDKGYISASVATVLEEEQGIVLHTLPKANRKPQFSEETRHAHNALRQIVETVNSQLADQFHIEINHARTFTGLCARLLTKLAAHTLSVYLNRLLGNANFLQVKALAFPN